MVVGDGNWKNCAPHVEWFRCDPSLMSVMGGGPNSRCPYVPFSVKVFKCYSVTNQTSLCSFGDSNKHIIDSYNLCTVKGVPSLASLYAWLKSLAF